MERLKMAGMRRAFAEDEAERKPRCLRCGFPVREVPPGCKGVRCPNCRHPYPLGDCSD